MDIATNAVLTALLLQVSSFVKQVEVPVPVPLDVTNATSFRLWTTRSRDGTPELECYIAFDGFEFRHNHGAILSFNSPSSYMRLQEPSALPHMLGEPHFTEQKCLQKARDVVRRLGYTNASILTEPPKVRKPSFTQNGLGIPRYVFKWPLKTELRVAIELLDAEIEVDAAHLTIENLSLEGPQFWREGWPITYGTGNTYEEPDPTEPRETELTVRDVSRDYALAFIEAALPEIRRFCEGLGPPIPSGIAKSDLVMGASQVAINNGRVTASLRLRSGHLVVFHAGHVWAVHARDAWYNRPALRKYVKESPEYRDPTRYSKEQAVQKVRQILLENLGLPEKELYLDTQPVFDLIVNPGATNGVRRYAFHWQRPDVPADRENRIRENIPSRISVSAEVDAVSGAIKALNFLHESFERADPNISVPMR